MNKGIDVRDFSKMFLLALCKNSEIKMFMSFQKL